MVFWMSYGFFSFYATGSFIGFTGNNLKTIALVGLGLGVIRHLTSKDLIYLFLKEKP